MFYIGCLPLLAVILLMVVLSLVKGAFRTLYNVLYGLLLTIQDWWYGLFRPSPTESEIEDIHYFKETEERSKIYDKKDGEYVRFKEKKNK